MLKIPKKDEIRFVGRVDKSMTIPPKSQATVLMKTRAIGPYMFELIPSDIIKTELLIAEGIVEVVSVKPFLVLVEDLNEFAYNCPKHSKLAELMK